MEARGSGGSAIESVFPNGDKRRAIVIMLLRRTNANQIAQGFDAGFLGRATLLHEHHNAVTDAGAHHLVAVPGSCRTADVVIHIETGADDRRVPYPARHFPGHATRRAADSEIAVSVERAEADGVVVIGSGLGRLARTGFVKGEMCDIWPTVFLFPLLIAGVGFGGEQVGFFKTVPERKAASIVADEHG